MLFFTDPPKIEKLKQDFEAKKSHQESLNEAASVLHRLEAIRDQMEKRKRETSARLMAAHLPVATAQTEAEYNSNQQQRASGKIDLGPEEEEESSVENLFKAPQADSLIPGYPQIPVGYYHLGGTVSPLYRPAGHPGSRPLLSPEKSSRSPSEKILVALAYTA